MSKPEVRKVTLAIFKEVEYGFETFVVKDSGLDGHEGYVRKSEYVAVEFPMRSVEQVVADEVESLDKQIEEFKAKSIKTLQTMEGRKAELLALTHNKEPF